MLKKYKQISSEICMYKLFKKLVNLETLRILQCYQELREMSNHENNCANNYINKLTRQISKLIIFPNPIMHEITIKANFSPTLVPCSVLWKASFSTEHMKQIACKILK